MAMSARMKELAEDAPLDISDKILMLRQHRVVLDETLAALFGVETRSLNQAVRRNRERFPPDFLLEIDPKEWEILRSQIVILRSGHGRHRKYPPLAFTEHGAIWRRRLSKVGEPSPSPGPAVGLDDAWMPASDNARATGVL